MRLLAVAVLVGATLAGCTAGDGGGELVILSGRDDSVNAQRQALLQTWNDQHPGHQARIVELSGLADQQHDEMIKDAQADDGVADVYNLDVTWTAEFADAKKIRALHALPAADEADFLPGPLASGRYDGNLYALPFNTDAGLVYYRTDLVSCPASWDDVRRDAARLATAPQPRPAAWAGQLAEYEGLVVNVLESLDTGVAPADRDLFRQGLPALQAAVDRLRPPVVVADALGYDEAASTQALRQGKVAMLRNWPVAYRTLTATSPENPAVGRNIGVCRLPGGGAVLGGQNLAVSANSRQPDLAEELVRFLTTAEHERTLFRAGGLAPARASAYGDPGDTFAQQIKAAVMDATPRPQGPCYIRFSALFSHDVHASLTDGTPLTSDFLVRLRRALDCKPLPG